MNYDAEATTDDGSCTYDTTGAGEGGGGIEIAECEDTVSMYGYDYAVVAIGSQCWFAENLRTTVFQDSTEIPLETGSAFPDLTSAARSQYNNSSSYVNTGDTSTTDTPPWTKAWGHLPERMARAVRGRLDVA